MSTINKLSIRGIRSFGTDKEDEQKITFTSPLTLIVGENGCGKTTVIECLKYALTGETPPGSDKGKTFVHDPKIFRGTTALGQVKLQVTDTMGAMKTCIRSMKMDIVKGKPKFATLDSTIITEDATGLREESGRRLEEVNNEMANAMGVSKAILNNVIFCHQEDSAWPMDEGQKLKQKFDAIFGTTEYNKAIDKIIKFRKEYQEKLKICVTEKKFLKETKDEADKKQMKFNELKENHSKMEKKVEEFENLLAPIDGQIEVLMKKEKDFSELLTQKGAFKATINNNKLNADSTRKRIKEFLQGNADELQEKLNNFLQSQTTRETALNIVKNEQKKLEDDERKLNESMIKDKSKSESHITHLGQMQDLIEQRVKAIKALCEMMDLNLDVDMESQSMSVEDLGTSLHRIQRSINDKEFELTNQKSKDDAKDAGFQQQLDKVREEKTAVETNLSTQRQRVKTLADNHDKTKREISTIERSMPNLSQIDDQIEAAEKELEKVKTENSVEDLEEERVMIEADKDALEQSAAGLEEDVEKLDSVSKLSSDLEQKKSELSKDQSDFERIKNKNSLTLKQLFPGKKVERAFKATVETFVNSLNSEVKGMKDDLQSAKMTESRLHTEREHLRNQHKKKNHELNEVKEKVEKVTSGADFMDLLTSQKDKVDKLNMDLAFHKSSASTFSVYVKDIEQEPCCPLCHKHLEANETDDLKEEIEGKIGQLPMRISETEKKLKVESKKFDDINDCKSSFESIEKFELEVKKLQDDLKRTEVKYLENKSKMEELELQIAEPELKLNTMTGSFMIDMMKLDDLMKSIAAKTTEIEEIKKKLPEEMPEKSLADAKNELRQLNADIKAKNEQIKTLNQEINKVQSSLNTLQDKRNKLVSQKMENQSKVQGLDRLRIQLKEIEKEKLEVEGKLKEDSRKLQPIIQKLADLSMQKEQVKKEDNRRQIELQEAISAFKDSQKDIERLGNDIEAYEKMELEKSIHDIQKRISEAKVSLKLMQEERKQKSAEIQRLTQENTDQEGSKRNLEDNLELRKIESQLKTAENELSILQKTMGDMDPSTIMREKKALRDRREKINDDRQLIRGQLKESKDRIDSAEKELNEKKFKKAKENHLDECINEQVLKAMINDLNKYRAALERALLKFHADKMVQINQSIRQYWNNIYKGNDIDYIMIKTDEEEIKAASDKKRSYSYRVVQCKNGGSEIDMRGRCSAGQKVLASLIIRMALADTFAANCGILALDEPTTNLDQNNIQALCIALTAIIEEREKVGNFMLLVITHDMEFVSALESTEQYFKLSRDGMGRSRIEKITNE